MANSSPDSELCELLRLRAKDLDETICPQFPTILSREKQLLHKVIYLLHRAANRIENGELQS